MSRKEPQIAIGAAVVVGLGSLVFAVKGGSSPSQPPGLFSEQLAPSGDYEGVVLVLAPKNCGKEAAQRAEALAQALSERDIPCERLDRVRFSFDAQASSRAEIDAEIARFKAKSETVNEVLGGEVPVVFVNTRASNDPTLEQVVAEYQRQTADRDQGPAPNAREALGSASLCLPGWRIGDLNP